MNTKNKNLTDLKATFFKVNKLIVLFMLTVSSALYAQENQSGNDGLRPFRIGLKIGFPTVVALDLEYVTPLLNNRIAPFVDFTSLSLKPSDDVKADYSEFEIGSNIYFNNKGDGSGFYGAVSYQSINAKVGFIDYVANDDREFEGTSTTKVTYGGLNAKVGVKLGHKFYFRSELGYSFGSIPTELLIEGTYNGAPATDILDIEEDINDTPLVSTGGMPIFNIGFGFAF